MPTRGATGILFGQIFVVLGVALGGVWAGTQWMAHALGHQARLGKPWFDLSGMPVYEPWKLFEWWYFFDAYAPQVFERGGIIAASSGILATGAAIGMAVWRSRLAKQVTTYGSARWAERDEIANAGLTRPAGVFLGKTQEKDGDYLRHEGPEHVMAFAPTCVFRPTTRRPMCMTSIRCQICCMDKKDVCTVTRPMPVKRI